MAAPASSSGFTEVPSVPIRNVIRSLILKTLEDLRALARDCRTKSPIERRFLLGASMKMYKHRFAQLRVLLTWGLKNGVIAGLGATPTGPLADIAATEARAMEQLTALSQVRGVVPFHVLIH